jgi:putative heme-binding domain-containing protein
MSSPIGAQSLDQELQRMPLVELAKLAKSNGDAVRGAVVFYHPQMACVKCHSNNKTTNSLGPDLTAIGKDVTDEALIESVLVPSRVIRKGFESATIVTTEGEVIKALLVERTDEKVIFRDVSRAGELSTLDRASVEEIEIDTTSIMPVGQINSLNSQQQFLDLIRYLMEIRDGGAERAIQLLPSASLIAFEVPEYESHLDHAGLIGDWNDEALERGKATYQRVCANCHGTKDQPGSLPTSLRFAEGKFKNGSDPLSMYRTLTHGFGLMAPQSWMVPSQKYDVIHYIRETYIKPKNMTEFVPVDSAYLAQLPKGDTRGPEPSKIEPWSAMDYGPSLTHTFEVPGPDNDLAYKGIAVRLDPGAGGVSRGRHWMMFDIDTLRVAAAWNGGNSDMNFIDWQGIQFNGAHGVHPRLVGQVAFANSSGPGWANPLRNDFVDDQRVVGRDGKRYGPLPREWGRFIGQYCQGQQVVFAYTIGSTEILELPGLLTQDEQLLGRSQFRQSDQSLIVSGDLRKVASNEVAAREMFFTRTFNIGPRERELVLQVAEHPASDAQPSAFDPADPSVVRFASPSSATEAAHQRQRIVFDGNTYLEIPNENDFDLTTQDFSIVARIRTEKDGTVWSLSSSGPKWTPDGQTLLVLGGRLRFAVGWAGSIEGKSKLTDGQWHVIAMTWQQSEHRVRLFVDGKLDGEGKLAAQAALPNSVVRIGFASPDFPRSALFFNGDIAQVRFYQRRLTEGLGELSELSTDDDSLIGRWLLEDVSGSRIADATAHHHDAEVQRGLPSVRSSSKSMMAGFTPNHIAARWTAADGRLRLHIPAGKEPLRFAVWQPCDVGKARFTPPTLDADLDLKLLTRGGPPRWPQKLETRVVIGPDDGPFAVDTLTAPETNPWLAQMRFTGLDFFPDGRIAVCSWDGDVWLVTPSPPDRLTWQRIASGLFQPLGLKIVEDKIHVICRDQLAVLHDLNGDGEIDFYRCLNNDHQVTEHFHEFAMGLQCDKAGNFYYAKSGCHAKAAVVPHHGTLLRVTRDGSRTDILANGFRAANGVCLNADGSFFITDQEGFWNPKNRINWVVVPKDGKPNFYGNMLGYHDVTDVSDAAMVPPLCWITNAFDRSPAELLWVESDRWGPIKGSLLNLSYGEGKLFLVPHENVHGQMQGGMIELPLPKLPTGVMRGRFHPIDGQLYLCGMFAWAGNATQPGGMYRLRSTGQLIHLPTQLHATKSGLKITFTEPLDPTSIDKKNLDVKTWSLKRTAAYGSQHFDEKQLAVNGASLSADSKTLTLDIPDLRPTWCMEIKYTLRSAAGTLIQGKIHNTIHELSD